MEKLQYENDSYILYSPDSLKYITDNMIIKLNQKLEFYKQLFDIEHFRKIQINYFDDINKFRKYIYDLRGEMNSLPQYAKGTFDGGMINAFIDSFINIETSLYYKKLYMASHELFHIMYQELIWQKENKKRIIWFDEGMAQLFSGENEELYNEEKFKKWFNELLNSTKLIPNLNELKHGTNFETDKYSGYKLSFISVKYLYDTLDLGEFKKLMHDIEKIEFYGDKIINDAIEFYKNNFKIKGDNCVWKKLNH